MRPKTATRWPVTIRRWTRTVWCARSPTCHIRSPVSRPMSDANRTACQSIPWPRRSSPAPRSCRPRCWKAEWPLLRPALPPPAFATGSRRPPRRTSRSRAITRPINCGPPAPSGSLPPKSWLQPPRYTNPTPAVTLPKIWPTPLDITRPQHPPSPFRDTIPQPPLSPLPPFHGTIPQPPRSQLPSFHGTTPQPPRSPLPPFHGTTPQPLWPIACRRCQWRLSVVCILFISKQFHSFDNLCTYNLILLENILILFVFMTLTSYFHPYYSYTLKSNNVINVELISTQ